MALVVTSLATHHQDVAEVKAGEMPVTVEVLPDKRKLPAKKCPLPPSVVLGQAPAAANEAPQVVPVTNDPVFNGTVSVGVPKAPVGGAIVTVPDVAFFNAKAAAEVPAVPSVREPPGTVVAPLKVLAPEEVRNAPVAALKSFATAPDASKPAVKVGKPVIEIAPLPNVTAPVEVLNAPVLPLKSFDTEPEAVSPPEITGKMIVGVVRYGLPWKAANPKVSTKQPAKVRTRFITVSPLHLHNGVDNNYIQRAVA